MKINVKKDPQNAEDCHWLKSNNSSKRPLYNWPNVKVLTKYVRSKKKLKLLKFESIGINNLIFINDSLCAYYKTLWAKYKDVDEQIHSRFFGYHTG